jgi:hypothetical protein
MEVLKLATAATMALFLGVASAAAQSADTTAPTGNSIEQPEGTTPSKPVLEQTTPGSESPAGQDLSIQGGAMNAAPGLDQAKCVQAKNENKVDDIKVFCPQNEWPPAQ